VAGLGLAPDVEAGRARQVRARSRLLPGGRVQAARDGGAEQVVPGGVELDLVDTVPVPVVGAQPRRVLVGQAPLLLRARRPREQPEPADPLDRVRRAEHGQRGAQRRVG
jgi:hypothetical protein